MCSLAARVVLTSALVAAVSLSGGCESEVLLNRTASFGGDTAGQRGQFQYVFINNTPYRAIFTAGTYDDLDEDAQVEFRQATNDPDRTTLEGNSSSEPINVPCARVLAIGTVEMLELIEENMPDADPAPEAMIEGVYFSSGEVGTEEGALPTEGFAFPLEARLGVDFACNSLVIIRFEVDDLGPAPFRIDYEVIPAEEDRNPPA